MKNNAFVYYANQGLILLCLIEFLIAFNIRAADPVVSNVRALQRPFAKLVDIFYDVEDADGGPLYITVKVSDNNGVTYVVPSWSFTGDLGTNVNPGLSKHIVWDAGKDWNHQNTNMMRFKVTASDVIPIAPNGMVLISAGTFMMGSPSTELDRDSNEGPQTLVTISQDFWMGKYEVTQKEYLALMGSNPSSHTGDLNLPVEMVTWFEATNYCGQLTQLERTAGRLPVGYVYRLPTEAEWEHACRAGTTTRFSYGDDLDYTSLGSYAWCRSNSEFITHPVGHKSPNAWGLYDMQGNVMEYCLDWFVSSLSGGSVTDPKGPSSGPGRVLRGAGCSSINKYYRSASRSLGPSDQRHWAVGFRIVLAPDQ